jgi:ADP-heptose:LPS heptosyltransferase
MVKRVPARESSRHIVDKLLDVVRYLGIDPMPVEFPIGLSDEEQARVSALLDGCGMRAGEFVVINPATAWRSKEWLADRFAHLADRIAKELGKRCLTLAGPADGEKLDEVRGAAGAEHTYLCGAVNLREYAELCRRAAAYVGGDTGPTHVAAAVGARCVVPMGPTDPIRNGPYGQGHVVIHKGHDCSPCKKKVCPDPVCMTEITTDEVFGGVTQVLSRL